MNSSNVVRYIAIACLYLGFGGCATPSSPTGGPRDKEGPKITESEPETGAVNVDKDAVDLHFSEFVQRGSLPKALTIEPDLGISHSLDWGRKSVAIKFDATIPDSTTVIITLGTDFSDMNGNKMAEPYKVAFSTGPDIDKGKLTGRVLDARTGKGQESSRVLLYRTPADLSTAANYIGETDTSGVFHFSYLSEGTYKAFWVDDRNRNKIWDPEQERAQPFNKELLTLAKAEEDSLGTLFVANSDTSMPVLQGVGLFSSHRLRMRFSENINLTDSTRMQIQDTTGNPYGDAYPLYIDPKTEYVLFAQSKKVLTADSSYQIKVQNIADAAGNVQRATVHLFTGSGQKDTTAQRVVGSSVGAGIFSNQPVTVAYATPITQAVIRDCLRVVQGSTVKKKWSKLRIRQNKVRVLPNKKWKKGVDYEFRFWNPIIKDYQKVRPNIWQPQDLGGLRISFADSTAEEAQHLTHLTLKTKEGKLAVDTTFTGEVEIDSLAPTDHQLRMYQDLNKNSKWDAGTVAPYAKPEPFYIQNNIPIKKGFTSDLVVSFKE